MENCNKNKVKFCTLYSVFEVYNDLMLFDVSGVEILSVEFEEFITF